MQQVALGREERPSCRSLEAMPDGAPTKSINSIWLMKARCYISLVTPPEPGEARGPWAPPFMWLQGDIASLIPLKVGAPASQSGMLLALGHPGEGSTQSQPSGYGGVQLGSGIMSSFQTIRINIIMNKYCAILQNLALNYSVFDHTVFSDC